MPESDFTEEELQNVWSTFLSKLSAKNKKTSSDILESLKITKLDRFQLKITSPSYTSQYEFDEVKIDFMLHAKEYLNNHKLKLIYELEASEEIDQMLSKEGIYKLMLKKNRNLENLRQELGLDFS